jgi:hypothetical protein
MCTLFSVSACREQSNPVVPADPRQHWPADAVHKPDFDMKARISREMCRGPHGGRVLRCRPQRRSGRRSSQSVLRGSRPSQTRAVINRSVFPTETTPREPVLYPCRTTRVTDRQTRRGFCGRYWRNVQSRGSGGARQHSVVSFESHHASDAIGLDYANHP